MNTDAEHFWLGLTRLPIAEGPQPRPNDSPSVESTVAVDVIRSAGEHPRIAILVSTVDDGSYRICCVFGLTNNVAWGDAMRQRGIPVAETTITVSPSTAGACEVVALAPLKAALDNAQAEGQPPQLLKVTGVVFAGADGSRAMPETFPLAYSQMPASPEIGHADTEETIADDLIVMSRVGSERPDADATLHVLETDLPQLNVYSGKTHVLTKQWCGQLGGALNASLDAGPTPSAYGFGRRPREMVATGYRFADVDLVGVRIDLGAYGTEADKLLAGLVERLNFHLGADPGEALGFQYRAASRTVMIEMLRYGRMYWGRKPTPGEPDRFESQYELLMRVLVGRVDDASAQARNPAVFVPAIFVDNAWSKLVGREYQGFEKQLACFLDAQGNELSAAGPLNRVDMRLFDVATVKLVGSPDPRIRQGRESVLDIALPPIASDWRSRAEPLDSPVVSLAVGPRWRQRDFSRREFRRSFAREAMSHGFENIHSIQVAPIDRRPLPCAWITGTIKMRDFRAAFPPGVAVLKLHSARTQGTGRNAFQQLNDLLLDQPIAMPSGSWYIGHGSMNLDVHDGLV